MWATLALALEGAEKKAKASKAFLDRHRAVGYWKTICLVDPRGFLIHQMSQWGLFCALYLLSDNIKYLLLG